MQTALLLCYSFPSEHGVPGERNTLQPATGQKKSDPARDRDTKLKRSENNSRHGYKPSSIASCRKKCPTDQRRVYTLIFHHYVLF